MDQLKTILGRFSNARKDGIEEIKGLKQMDKKVVGTYCSFAPIELILASDAIPLRLCETTGEYVSEGEKYLPRNLCTIVKSSYGAASSGQSFYFNEADLVIGETTCDGKKKMYEYLKDLKPTHVMQLPQKSEGEEEYLLWKNEIERLREKLEQEFNIEITDEKIRMSIKTRNQERELLNELYKLWRTNPNILNSNDIHNVLFNFDYRIDKDKAVKDIKELIQIIEREPITINKQKDKTPKILLTGCPLGEKFDIIISLIEQSGGNLVAIETCDWMKGNEELVNEDIDPVDAISQKYLNIPCPVMTPNSNRLKIISKYIDDYNVDGVIDLTLQSCLTFSVETIPLKKFITGEKHISYMNFETNITSAEIGQLRTRIEAFIEML